MNCGRAPMTVRIFMIPPRYQNAELRAAGLAPAVFQAKPPGQARRLTQRNPGSLPELPGRDQVALVVLPAAGLHSSPGRGCSGPGLGWVEAYVWNRRVDWASG